MIIFLSGCDDFPKILPQERCLIVLESDEGPYCRCHLYEWNTDRIGKVGDSKDYDIMKCNKLVGFSPESTGTIYLWQEEVRLWLKRKGKNK
jgi:hypothetical protein